jgi:hypothetical protein
MQQPKAKDLNAAFSQLARALNKKVGTEKGEWHLEFTGGGWRIRSFDSKNAARYPLGSNCYSPREFLIALFFAGQVLTAYESSHLSIMGGESNG